MFHFLDFEESVNCSEFKIKILIEQRADKPKSATLPFHTQMLLVDREV